MENYKLKELTRIGSQLRCTQRARRYSSGSWCMRGRTKVLVRDATPKLGKGTPKAAKSERPPKNQSKRGSFVSPNTTMVRVSAKQRSWLAESSPGRPTSRYVCSTSSLSSSVRKRLMYSVFIIRKQHPGRKIAIQETLLYPSLCLFLGPRKYEYTRYTSTFLTPEASWEC